MIIFLLSEFERLCEGKERHEKELAEQNILINDDHLIPSKGGNGHCRSTFRGRSQFYPDFIRKLRSLMDPKTGAGNKSR